MSSSSKMEEDKMALQRLADTYWEESIIPIQSRIAELTVQIKAETVREERYRLERRKAALRALQNELVRTAVHLETYYRGKGDDV